MQHKPTPDPWPRDLREHAPAYSFKITQTGHVAEIWQDNARIALPIPDNERKAPLYVRIICEHGRPIGGAGVWTLQEARICIEGFIDQLCGSCGLEHEDEERAPTRRPKRFALN